MQDHLKYYRSFFHIPQKKGKELIYFCGNSLGLQPKSTKEYLTQELNDWAALAVEGHFNAQNPWYNYHNILSEQLATLIGAKRSEVVSMNALTVNLHLLLTSFYKPTKYRNKIIIENPAFSSDYYAICSQIEFHGLKPEDVLIEVSPKPGKYIIELEDIIQTIDDHADSLALIMMGGINYYSGQVMDMHVIAKKGKEVGALVGFDLAHAIGNVVLDLHGWEVDFATWCSYKYLNSGPGGVSGIFIHEKNFMKYPPAFKGWWGHNAERRFLMEKEFIPQSGAEAWQLSNAPILSMAVHKASLDIFEQAGLYNLREKSIKMTIMLFDGIDKISSKYNDPIQIITPKNPDQRGCQLSLLVKNDGHKLSEYLFSHGIVTDWREPNVIRIAPVPLYNTFEEIVVFLNILEDYYNAQ